MPALRVLVFFCALLLGSDLAAAEIPPGLLGQPVVRVEIAGEITALITPREVGVPLGAPLSRQLVRAAIERLLATGRFTNVQIDALQLSTGVELIVRLAPRILVHRIDISGNTSLSDQAVRDALRIAAGSPISPEQLPELVRAISRAYAEHGYLGAQIDLSLRDTDDPSHKVLLVRIEEGSPTRIASIKFEGEQPLDPVAVRGVMQSAKGRVLDRATLSDDVHRAEAFLRGRGYLEAALNEPLVTIEGSRASVVIPTRIGPRYQVELVGLGPFARSEVFAALGVAGERLTPTLVRQTLGDRAREFYAKRGYPDAQVKVWVGKGRRPNSARLVVEVKPGKQLRVVSVSFAGSRHFSREFLRDQLFSYLSEALPGSSIVSPVDSEVVDQLQTGPLPRTRSVPVPPVSDPEEFYYAPAYDKAMEHIVELYREQGYLAARVGPAQVAHVGEDRAAVLIPVVEGPRSRLHEVRLEGARAISPRELLDLSGLRSDQPFSYVALEQARRRMLDAYHERGYAYAKVDATVRFSPDRTRAEVDLQVVESFPVIVERVVVRGADRTNEDLIRHVLTVEAGDVFRPSAARESERELGSLGVFTGVSVALEDPDLPARVKTVVVTVSERRNQFLDFGAGLSTGQGLRGGFEYGYRNLFGEAVSMTLRVQLAYQLFFVDSTVKQRFDALQVQDRLERRISLGTSIPRTPGLGRVRTSIDLVHLRDNERDFGLDQNAIGLTFTHSPLQYLTLTLGGDLENNTVDLFVSSKVDDYLKMQSDPRLRRLLRVPDGTSTLIGARTSASYDRRDSAFTPTRGYFASASAELARTLSGKADEFAVGQEFVSRFLKLSATCSAYAPLGYGLVLAGQLRAGRIVHLIAASKTYPNRAFYLGGVDTMRGFLEDELIPQDLAESIARDPNIGPNDVIRGGDAFVLMRAELRFPIYGELRGGVFSDIGNLWKDAAQLNPLQLRPTAGFGLRLGTPVGPIALDLGFNLDRRAALSERASAVHFSIGLF